MNSIAKTSQVSHHIHGSSNHRVETDYTQCRIAIAHDASNQCARVVETSRVCIERVDSGAAHHARIGDALWHGGN